MCLAGAKRTYHGLSAGVKVNELVPRSVTRVKDIELVAHEWIESGSRKVKIELRIDGVSQCAVESGHPWPDTSPLLEATALRL